MAADSAFDVNLELDNAFLAEEVDPDDMLMEFINFEAGEAAQHNAVDPILPARQGDADLHIQANAVPGHDRAVFIRLDRVYLVIDDVAECFRWNRRSKSWYNDRNGRFTELSWLFEFPGPLLEVSVRPSGIGFPVQLAWDEERKWFGGLTVSGVGLAVLWGELKAMAADPWARQFQGYYTK